MIFGEGIFNDAVAIILFNTMSDFVDGEEVFTPATPFKIIGNFLLLAFCSILIGAIYGLLASLVLKHFRFVTVSAVKETLVVFSFGYLAYATGEIFHFSGIIA